MEDDGLIEVEKDWFNRFFVVVVPVGLVFATIIGIIIHVMGRDDGSQDIDRRLPRKISESELQDFHRKLSVLLGDRSTETEKTRRNLQAARNLVAGTLSPENAGYAVRENAGVGADGLLFRSAWVDLLGEKKRRVLRVVNRLDGDVDDAAATAVTLAIAQAMSADVPPMTIRFLFLTGLEKNPLQVSTKLSEVYAETLWVGSGAPEGVVHMNVEKEALFFGAIKVRERLDELLRQ